MKNKLILVSIFLIIGLLALGTKLVLAQTTLPRVTTACETKVGGLLMGVGDGFSSLKVCPGNSRKVSLGESGDSNVLLGGNVLFFYNARYEIGTILYVLMKDGHMYQKVSWENDGQYWQPIGTIPESIMQTGIAEWKMDYFITMDGKIYYKGAEAPTDGDWTLLSDLPALTN